MLKKIKLAIEDLISVLQALRDSAGTTDVILFDHDGFPAIADADEPDNIILFQQSEDMEEVDEDIVH